MEGVVTAGGEAVLTFDVAGEGERSIQVEAVIDTGFDGHLLLPPSMVDSLSLFRIGSTRPTLADGRIVPMTVYVARVVWHGRPRAVRVLSAEQSPSTGGALVGMALLRGSRLLVDVVPGGRVVVEELV